MKMAPKRKRKPLVENVEIENWTKTINYKDSIVHTIFWDGFENGKEKERTRIYRLIDDYMEKIEKYSIPWAVLNSIKFEDMETHGEA